MHSRRRHFLMGAQGRLLMFNLLVVAVTLMVSAVAIIGFKQTGVLQEQAQQQTLYEMRGSLVLGRDTANVATAALRLAQVVGALEYQSEAAQLQETLLALQSSVIHLAEAPLAQSEAARVQRITQRSQALEQSVRQLLELGRTRHLQRNRLLSELYQSQSYLRHIDSLLLSAEGGAASHNLYQQIDRLLTVAIQVPSPLAAIEQLMTVMQGWPEGHATPLISSKMQGFLHTQQTLLPLARQLTESDLAIAYHTYYIKALVAMLNQDINAHVQHVVEASELRTLQTQQELHSIILFITLFALLSLVITGFAGFYIYRNLGSNLTAIAEAMTRLAHGEHGVTVPALQRRDELGDLARAFDVFAYNTASLAQTSSLLQEKSTQLETTFLAMRDGFALFDSRGQLVVWNSQYPLLLGLHEQQLYREQHYLELLRSLRLLQALPAEPGGWKDAVARLGHRLPSSQELRLADGRVLELRFSPLPDGGMVNVVLERTEHKVLEEALVHGQKMKAVGQLTGGLAHDFNNLLAVIIGSLELAQQQDALTGQRISRALQAAERGAQLTQRLLVFSRKQALHPQAVRLQHLVANLQELLRHSLPATLRLEIEVHSADGYAWIDVSQLENAIINLVMNARDAMEGRSGTISLRLDEQPVVRSDGRQQEMVILEVIDHGSGMSEEVQARVFEPFFTTKPVGSGSGLGLSMVYGFIRQSGGRVQIITVPGEGTRVCLQLPRAAPPERSVEEILEVTTTLPAQSLILVLEDEEAVRHTLCEHLHQLGYLTLETADSMQALQLLRQTTEITGLISDLMLPGTLSGAEVLHAARQINPQLVMLLISGQDIRQQQGELPEVELLRKPFSQQQLRQALSRAQGEVASAER